MPLSIRYVRSLDDVIAPVLDFLSRPVDLFARPRVVVPTAGAKAWLAAKLAERLGATTTPDGTCIRDGVVAHVDFSHPGTISRLLSATPRNDDDPWEVERLTFTILEVLIAKHHEYARIVKRAGGPLLAARRIADRFDHYHFRRPGMILAWEEGRPTLSPWANADGTKESCSLGMNDLWQFMLWRAVREAIDEASPPARERLVAGPAPDAVLVAGLQGLSLHQIELLERLGTLPTRAGEAVGCDVQVVLVHPSQVLREVWGNAAPMVSPGLAPIRGESQPAPDQVPDPARDQASKVDPLVDAWLRGTREAQWLLASQNLHPVHDDRQPPTPPATNAPLLERLQHTVEAGRVAVKSEAPAHRDDSVRIHRCHDLGRQAEVLHDAILHAFREIPGLAPHDVVIVSPQIANLASHLEAVFNRTVTGKSASDEDDVIELPLLVADRGIREVSRGAELLAAILELVGSRCSVDAMLAVASHELVQKHFGLDDEAVENWQRCIERTKIRWGLDESRRERQGLAQPGLRAHTWRLGLERMLLGAVIPDGPPEPVLGEVVPLPHVDTFDIKSLAPLVSIFRVIDDLDQTTSVDRPVGDWCDLLEKTLGQLAGDEHDELFLPLREIDALRQAAATAKGTAPQDASVPYHDVKSILSAKLAAPVGHQPLRTGAITATSMIPLRGVPFRVVCLAGFDDEAVSPRESDSEDLVDRQEFPGDADSRLDIRRGFLDCMLAAKDRLIITCTGMDVKNNATRPLVTPLAEFCDFVARHGVPSFKRDGGEHSGIEVFHPRHACSRRNFVVGEAAVVPGDAPWSHDAAALAAAEGLGKEVAPAIVAAEHVEPPTHIELEWLAEFMVDPLWPYVKKTLGITTWREDDLSTPATLPLELETFERRNLRDDYIEKLLGTDAGRRPSLAASWAAAVKVNGDVPILGYGDDAIAEITQFSDDMLKLATAEKVPLDQGTSKTIDLDLDGVRLSGTIDRWYPESQTIVLMRPDADNTQERAFLRAKTLAALQVLALHVSTVRAADPAAERGMIFSQKTGWHPGHVDKKGHLEDAAQARVVKLAEDFDPSRASEILTTLCKLYQEAAVHPRGLFGDTAATLFDGTDAARDAFHACVSSDRYGHTNEAVVFGGHPDFDTVFGSDTAVIDFFKAFIPLSDVKWVAKAKAYIYSPQ